MRAIAWGTVAFLAGALPAALATAQVPAGGEFRVNANTAGVQALPAVGVHANGDFVAGWLTSQLSGYDVAGRRFDAAGAPRGDDFRVTLTAVSEFRPALAAEARGGFVLVWQNLGADGSGNAILGRRYDARGVAQGQEFMANAYTTGDQLAPAVASTGGGGFVVVWHSVNQDGSGLGVFGRRFDPAGQPLGSEFAVNTYTTDSQSVPSVAADGQGRFVVVWGSVQDGETDYSVFGQRFNADGSRLGGEFRLNASTTGFQGAPQVAALPGGEFVVVWQDSAPVPIRTIEGRRFDSQGLPVGGDFTLRQVDKLFPPFMSVAVSGAGEFTLVWESPEGVDLGIAGQRFTAAGAARGPAFAVNSSTTGQQLLPDVASDPSGNLLVAWMSDHVPSQAYDIYAQRYGGLFPSALAVDTTANGVLEPGESVDVRPSWRNLNGAAQTFSGTLATLTGPAGAAYTITDASGDYGSVANGDTQACADCYGVAVSNPPMRPRTHWDAVATEAISPEAQGQVQRWSLHVGDSFADVPRANAFYPFVETLLHQGISGGCAATAYCPAVPLTREQMAVFVLVAKEGAGYAPTACVTPPFNDVPAESIFCRWIAELSRRGVTAGCAPGLFCPTSPVSREQMAVFVLRTLDPTLDPPACTTPVFSDVPAESPFCRWIEELVRRGVVSGCAPQRYCPADPVTREQMAVFLTETFDLTLYGP